MSLVTEGGTVGTGIKRLSASKRPDLSVKKEPEFAILVDISACIGCKACEAACQQWHNLNPPILSLKEAQAKKVVGFQSARGLSYNLFTCVFFKEGESKRGFTWFISKIQCMHCREPGCLKACPSPGAVIQYDNGIIDFDHSKCIGCKMCYVGCPFAIPRFDENSKPWKCNFCIDRVMAGMEPACVKTCPTGCLSFGFKEDMVAKGKKLVERLKKNGFENAMLYDPKGVGGTGYIYVLPHGDQVENYHLPKDPAVSFAISAWKGPLKVLGGIAIGGAVLGAILHQILYGPIKEKESNKEVSHE